MCVTFVTHSLEPTSVSPWCLPAFRPDRCIREDGPGSEVSKKLNVLHSTPAAAPSAADAAPPPEVLYHMVRPDRYCSPRHMMTFY